MCEPQSHDHVLDSLCVQISEPVMYWCTLACSEMRSRPQAWPAGAQYTQLLLSRLVRSLEGLYSYLHAPEACIPRCTGLLL